MSTGVKGGFDKIGVSALANNQYMGKSAIKVVNISIDQINTLPSVIRRKGETVSDWVIL